MRTENAAAANIYDISPAASSPNNETRMGEWMMRF